MTELERRAMMGDKQAQHDCTAKGIILPCLKCHGEVKISSVGQNGNRLEMGFRCNRCGLELVYGQYLLKGGMDIFATENPTPLAQWNDRTEPSVGRCGECKHFDDEGKHPVCWHTGLKIRSTNDYCCYFEQKEYNENDCVKNKHEEDS